MKKYKIQDIKIIHHLIDPKKELRRQIHQAMQNHNGPGIIIDGFGQLIYVFNYNFIHQTNYNSIKGFVDYLNNENIIPRY